MGAPRFHARYTVFAFRPTRRPWPELRSPPEKQVLRSSPRANPTTWPLTGRRSRTGRHIGCQDETVSHIPESYLRGHLVVVIDCDDLDRSARFWTSVRLYPRGAARRDLSEPESRNRPGDRDPPATRARGKDGEEPAAPGSADRRPGCRGRPHHCARSGAADQHADYGGGLALAHSC